METYDTPYNTPYDNVFRTLLTDCGKLVIPLINTVFDEHYTGEEQVVLKENEVFLKTPDKKRRKRITDSSFVIVKDAIQRHYHLECQSSPDGTMIIRIYEYDSQIALKEGKWSNNHLEVNFPRSAILFLRHTSNTPDVLTIKINTPGGAVSYEVPALKAQNYDLETIFQKNLLFLLPFYLFTYEKQFPEIEHNGEKLEQLKQTYQVILERLNGLVQEGKLTEYTKRALCEMTEEVVEALAYKHPSIREEVTKVMGGQVLEYEAKDILRQGIKEGLAAGREEGLTAGREEGLAAGRKESAIRNARRSFRRNISEEVILADLQEDLGLSDEEARELFEREVACLV